ncbi:MAG: hypothetical protein V2A73_20840 [Pseudomonadota bacterium]
MNGPPLPLPLPLLLLLPVVLIAAATWPRFAMADAPVARMAAVTGLRINTGPLGERYSLSYLMGAEAGYEPRIQGTALSAGLTVTFIVTSALFEGPRADLNVESDLTMVEMGLGARTRYSLNRGDMQFLVFVQAEIDAVRASIPVPPSDRREYFGPTATAGFDIALGSNWLVTVGLRYGLIAGGPTGMGLVLALAAGE